MRRAIGFLSGLMLGALVGATLAYLYAPAPGSDLQMQLSARIDRFRNEIKQAATDRRAELEERLASLRSPHSTA